jgi:hypothetical protein
MAGFGVVIETYHVSPVRNPSFMQQRHFDTQLLDIIGVSPRAVGFEELTTALLALVALSASTVPVFRRLSRVTLRTLHPSIVPTLALPFQQCHN